MLVSLEGKMLVNRSYIIQAILDEQDEFFKFIDYINENNTGGEFPIQLYVDFYNQTILPKVNIDPLKLKLKNILDRKSMVENGIFFEMKGSGMFAINNIVLEILSFIDTKRSKQIFEVQFELLRENTISLAKEIQKHPIGSEEQLEAIAAFRQLLNEVQTKVIENHKVLDAKVNDFSAEYARYQSGDTSITLDGLFQRIDTLYQRNVKPFIQFTTTENLVVGGSFTTAISQIIKYFDTQDLNDLAKFLSFRKTSITTYYKDVGDTNRKIQRTLNQIGSDRSMYLAIEHLWSKIDEYVDTKRHGGGSKIKLNKCAEVFDAISTFDGLFTHNRNYGERLNLQAEGNFHRFEWHYERILSKPVQAKIKQQQPLPAKIYKNLERTNKIARLVYQMQLPNQIDDIVWYIHETFQSNLSEYCLTDLLDGLEALLPRLKGGTKGTSRRNRVEDENYYYDYLILKFDKELIYVC